jgi:hypothetical protein
MTSEYPMLFNLLDVGNQLLLVLAAALAYVTGHKLRFCQLAGAMFPIAVGCAFTSHVFAIRFGLTGSTVMTSCWVFFGLVSIKPTHMTKAFAMVFAIFSTVVYFRYAGSVEPLTGGFLIFLASAIIAAVCTLAFDPLNRKFLPICIVAGLIPVFELTRILGEHGTEFDRQYIAENRRTF